MQYTLRTGTGNAETVDVRFLEVSPQMVRGQPELVVEGDVNAARWTPRILRAAQTHFEFPIALPSGELRSGTDYVARDQIEGMFARKQITACIDRGSSRLRMFYREIVVRFVDGLTDPDRQASILASKGLVIRRTLPFQPLEVIAVDDGTRRLCAAHLVERACELSPKDGVAFALPNFVSQYYRCSGDESAGDRQWHLDAVRARQAWKISKGDPSIRIAVLDDGIDVDHPALAASVVGGEDSSSKRDTCGRDFWVDDDAPDHLDPRPKKTDVPFTSPRVNDIHGTACAGLAAGDDDRAPGIARRCKILPVKIFFGSDMARDDRVVSAIRYASRNAHVLSCSWSGQRGHLNQAINEAVGQGKVIVCASGNFDGRGSPDIDMLPALNERCIAVGALMDSGRIPGYSKGGPTLSVVAPGDGGERGVWATDVHIPGRGFNTGRIGAGGLDGLFTNAFGGTSSACAITAGVAALILSVRPNLTPAKVKSLIEGSASQVEGHAPFGRHGRTDACGHGRVDAEAALRAALQLPA